MNQPSRLQVGPLPVDRVTFEQALNRICELVDAGQGGTVFTPNVDHVVIGSKNPAFREAYQASSLSLADGMPVVWASRLLGAPVPEKVSGSDLILPLIERAAEKNYKLFLLGGAEGVGQEAATVLRERYPSLQIVGIEAPRIEATQPPPADLIARIRESGAQLLLVAFGAPKQELFIQAARSALGPCVAVGVGGSLDFVAGRTRRSPAWMSRAGLEWLHRLSREPRRLWKRYLLQDPAFAAILLGQVLRRVRIKAGRELWDVAHNQLRWRTKHFFDLALVALAVFAGTYLGHRTLPGRDTFWFAGSLGTLWLFAATLIKHYDFTRRRSYVDDIAIVSLLALMLGSVVWLTNNLARPPGLIPSTGQFLTVFLPLAIGARLFVNRGRYRPDHAPDIEELVVLGTGPLARITQTAIARRPESVLLGFIPMRADETQRVHGPILGGPGALEQVLREYPVTEVYIAGHLWKQSQEIQEAIQVCERFGVNFALPLCGFRLERARPLRSQKSADGYQHYSCVPPLNGQLAFKRLIDIAGSAFGLLLLSPLLITVAVLVKLTSRGPVFFRQVRSGLHGRQFRMLKFRSMVIDAEAQKAKYEAQNEQSGPVFKIRNDPRITPIGRFLRKFSIDELPQLLNVLRGDMSLVGPRPPVPNEVAQYKSWQRRRLSMRPGLTCTWQVSGRNDLSFLQWMYLDMAYIDHWSLAEDFKLILQTVPVVFSGRGAS